MSNLSSFPKKKYADDPYRRVRHEWHDFVEGDGSAVHGVVGGIVVDTCVPC